MRLAWIALGFSLVACGGNAAVDPLSVLASFDLAMSQHPEGVASVDGTPFVGFVGLGKIVRVNADKTYTEFGTMPGTVNNTFTIGIVPDASGNLFVGVGATGASPVPAPGIYKIAATGGTATRFDVTGGTMFPNGLDLDGTDLYVTDSAAGKIFQVTSAGVVTTWLSDPLLAGDVTACGGSGAGVGFAVGANGITHDASNRYVVVTDLGRLVKIPILTGGRAGTPTVVKEDCTALLGADGVALEAGGTFLVARNGAANSVVRVSADGRTVTTLKVGNPLDGPASIWIDSIGGNTRALITNSALFSGANGHPALLQLDL